MHAELQVLSPLVPVREVSFLRFCKQHAEGVWAVVDVSIDANTGGGSCRRLPSGCVVQDMPNGYSKVNYTLNLRLSHYSCIIFGGFFYLLGTYYYYYTIIHIQLHKHTLVFLTFIV